MDAVVFDIGGVLLDWNPNHLYGELIPDPVEREHFLTTIATPMWNLRQDAGRPWAEAVAELITLYPEYDEWIAAYHTDWLRMCRGIFADTAELHDELRSAGTPTSALTNFPAEKWLVAIEAFPLLTVFDGAVISGLEQTTKPDERIYRILLERYHLNRRGRSSRTTSRATWTPPALSESLPNYSPAPRTCARRWRPTACRSTAPRLCALWAVT